MDWMYFVSPNQQKRKLGNFKLHWTKLWALISTAENHLLALFFLDPLPDLWRKGHCCLYLSSSPLALFTEQQQQQQLFYGPFSRTTQVSQYQKKHSPTHQSSFISFLHLPRSIACSLFNLRAWQSFCTTSLYYPYLVPELMKFHGCKWKLKWCDNVRYGQVCSEGTRGSKSAQGRRQKSHRLNIVCDTRK